MLEPKKSDIPSFFLVLVVLPVVLYILLGKWSESAKRNGRINLIVEEGFEKALEVEPMATTTASAVPFIVPPPISPVRDCARCHGPATTRCARCKSVRYCSGKCQIIHWRQGHKEKCQPPDYVDSYSRNASFEEAGSRRDFVHGHDTEFHGHDTEFHGYASEWHMHEKAQFNVEVHAVNPGATFADTSCSASRDACEMSKPERRTSERKTSRKTTKQMSDVGDRATTDPNLKEANSRQKPRVNRHTTSENNYPEMHDMNGSGRRYESQSTHGIRSQNGDSLLFAKRGMDEVGVGSDYSVHAREVSSHSEEGSWRNSLSHVHSSSGSKDAANVESVRLSKAPKSMTKGGREQIHPAKLRKGNGSNESGAGKGTSTSTHETDGATSIGLMKSMGLKKLIKMSRKDVGLGICGLKKDKVLFPFEDFVRFFQHEVFDLAPRGLQNCGNSCYANAVLQCLTCTKPLVAYLLSRFHSRACCRKNWCLMCELEQHVMMLKEASGPLSPSRILSHMRGINCQIDDGSQEDAHEFLRLLVTSMQSLCLEEVGGESQVHPFLQETTFVQQTFGGRLRSKVLCLRCHHESERYENIMDLTLEIYGWVTSLEDALTQFTTPEDLDGENMYRCARCVSYVRARKQLSVDEAPNILTIVLKRFQEGSYGKINKFITFPEMLDMVPFMTGTNDIPPLYMLYGMVVHVDTLNASFSGHYVSYVKDLQGNWFRIDDSVVQPVPTSQVMSEGAYILFYTRTFPRPPRVYISKATKNQASMSCGQNAHRANRCTRSVETYTDPSVMEFSDATSSDRSLFTSSDDASFTSESTRDSLSNTDYSDTCHVDPSTSSMFSTRFVRDRPSQRTVSCRMFSGSEPVTRYISEQTGYILDSDNSNNPLEEIYRGANTRQVSVSFNEAYLPCDYGNQNFVDYESSSDGYIRTFSDFRI